MNENEAALICRALGDSNRLKIVKLLSDGEKCACCLLEKLDITQPTLSHHMNVLCECGLVEARKDGKWSHYTLKCRTFEEYQKYIASLTCCRKDRKRVLK